MNPTETSLVGKTNVRATHLGLGTAPLGGWPTAVSEAEGIETIERSWELGLRYFDTAPFYGYGQSERWVGRVLRNKPREDFALSTKVGRLLVPTDQHPGFYQGDHTETAVFDFSYEGVKKSFEESLERMGIDRVDVVLIHDPDVEGRVDEALDGAYRAVDELRSQGVISAVGAGMNHSEPLVHMAKRVEFDCVLLAGRYTLLEQGALDGLLPLAVEREFSVVVGGAFNSGVLIDPSPGTTYDYAPAPVPIIERARRIHEVCQRHGVSPKAAALQFPLAHPAVATVVIGARSPEQIEENSDLMRVEIPPEFWVELRERRILDDRAPVPQ